MAFNLEQLEFLKEAFFDRLDEEYLEQARAEMKKRKEKDPTYLLLDLARELFMSTLDKNDPKAMQAYERLLEKDPEVVMERKLRKFLELKKVIEEDVRVMRLKASVNKANN